MKKGQSAPSLRTFFSISVSLMPRRKSWLRPFIMKAASELPPPRPAPEGMFLVSRIDTGGM